MKNLKVCIGVRDVACDICGESKRCASWYPPNANKPGSSIRADVCASCMECLKKLIDTVNTHESVASK